MSILVINCEHWIGFHVVDTLLNNDFEVDGISTDSNPNDSLMFFGRNSSFSLITKANSKEYEVCIMIGDSKVDYTIYSQRTFGINQKRKIQESNTKEWIAVETPLLFGEWMPMNQNGCYRDEEFIPFDSSYFKENALYIKDFTKVLVQWIKAQTLPSKIRLMNNKKNETGIFVRNQENIEKKLEQVKKHYIRMSKF